MHLPSWPPAMLSSFIKNWASLCNKDLSTMLRDVLLSAGSVSPLFSVALFLRTLRPMSAAAWFTRRWAGESSCTRFDVSLIDGCVMLEMWHEVIGYVGLDSIVSRRRLTSSWWYVVLAARAECQLASDWVFALVDRLSVDSSRCPLSGDMSCSISTWFETVLSMLGDSRSGGEEICSRTQTKVECIKICLSVTHACSLIQNFLEH